MQFAHCLTEFPNASILYFKISNIVRNPGLCLRYMKTQRERRSSRQPGREKLRTYRCKSAPSALHNESNYTELWIIVQVYNKYNYWYNEGLEGLVNFPCVILRRTLGLIKYVMSFKQCNCLPQPCNLQCPPNVLISSASLWQFWWPVEIQNPHTAQGWIFWKQKWNLAWFFYLFCPLTFAYLFKKQHKISFKKTTTKNPYP